MLFAKIYRSVHKIYLLCAVALLAFPFFSNGQTRLASPALLDAPQAAGIYYNETSITLLPPNPTTGAPGYQAIGTATDAWLYYISNIPCYTLGTYATAGQNYIITSIPRKEGVDPSQVGLGTCELMQSIQYFDGLGRLVQTVQVKGNFDGTKDIITPTSYDEYGRESTTYLPYAASSAQPGSFRADALAASKSFYFPTSPSGTEGAQQSNGIVFNDSPFAKTVFEASPLSKVKEQGAPGTPWQPGAHTGKIAYLSNDTSSFVATTVSNNPGSRKVALYTASINTDFSRTLQRANNNAVYASGSLSVTIIRDENWKSTDGCIGTTEEYKDKDGKVVLKRTYNKTKNASNQDIVEMLSTYYVYDDLGNLAFVLVPAVKPDATTAVTNIDAYCYQYQYDERNRLARKKLPGKGWEYMVYNKLDQVVATQDAMQRNKSPQEWTVTKYDGVGRVILTGIYQYTGMAGADYYDAVKGVVNTPTAAKWEVATGTSTDNGYSNTSFPSAVPTVLTVNYYDDYRLDGVNPYPYTGTPLPTNQTMGLLTGSKTNILGTQNKLWEVNYYNPKGENSQAYKQHYLGGVINANNYDVVNTKYLLTGEEESVIRTHYTVAGGSNGLVIATRDEYDHMGRKLYSYHKIGNGTEYPIAKYDYNEVGQLWKKHLHSNDNGSTFKQDIVYGYNQRGWMQKINDVNNVKPTEVFAEQLQYDDGTIPQYNGNISGSAWQTKLPIDFSGTQQKQSYSYTYDDIDRLTLAAYTTPGAAFLNKYNEQVSYDVMGNITKLSRTNSTTAGQYLNNFTNYDYTTGGAGNKLWAVTDAGTAAQSSTYDYDLNGNVKKDTRNLITNIDYNLLNLPQLVTRTGGNLTYVYDASGSKLRKLSSGTPRDYIDGIEYDNGVLDFITTEEGRARPSGGVYVYEYYLKDHLGNTRAAIMQDGGIVQVQDYYAFGLEMGPSLAASPAQRYKYNGKEKQDETGQYDYGARFYDPVISRWTAIDPLSEKARRWSPYVYGDDNSVRNIDPDGMQTQDGNCCYTFTEREIWGNGMSGIENIVYSARDMFFSGIHTVISAYNDVGGFGPLHMASGYGSTHMSEYGYDYSSGSRELVGHQLSTGGEKGFAFTRGLLGIAGGIPSSGPLGLLAKAPGVTSSLAQLTRAERIAILAEANAGRQLAQMEASVPGAHFFSRHGAATTMAQQQTRALKGFTPDGIQKNPVDATKFTSNLEQLRAVQQIQLKYNRNPGALIKHNMERTIGNGYQAVTGQLGSTTWVYAQFNKSNQMYTMYPKLNPKP